MSDTDIETELAAIRARYERRTSLDAGQYGRLQPDVLLRVQERQRVMVELFKHSGIDSLANKDILEVGSGSGANLLEFIEFGADPTRLIGNDLLADRLAIARHLLPSAVRLMEGDASQLPLRDEQFDIVYQSTVFSSILSSSLQLTLAQSIWRWIKPGGALLWYDFMYNNPRNPDVQGVGLARIRELYPEADIAYRRVTLAPPLARRLARFHPALCVAATTLPFLRTHLLCWIRKR